MDADTARALLAQGEGQRTEFKRTLAEEREAVISLCAFAHAEGGTVFFGVDDSGEVLGAHVGRNTLENLANSIRRGTDPPLAPSIERLELDGRMVVAVTVLSARADQLIYAFNAPYIRVGKTNQVMSPEEQRARLESTADVWTEERDRPHFEATQQAVSRLENAFQPTWKLRQVSGDHVANLEWRFRGPRFQMAWRAASGSALERTTISETFDLTAPPSQDELIGVNELGLEVRFHWRGKWRYEVHRYPITRNEMANKVLWDIGREVLPPLYSDEYDPPSAISRTSDGHATQARRHHVKDLLRVARELREAAGKPDRTRIQATVDRPTRRLMEALRNHIPESPLWPAMERWEEASQGLHAVELQARERLEERLGKEFVSSKLRFLHDGFMGSLMFVIRSMAQDTSLSHMQYKEERSGDELRLEWGAFTLSWPLPVVGGVTASRGEREVSELESIRAVHGQLVDEVSRWPEVEKMHEFLARWNREREAIQDEVDTLLLSHDVSGSCDFCRAAKR